VLVRSVDEVERKEVADAAVIEESKLVPSVSSALDVDKVSFTNNCGTATVTSDNHMSLSSPGHVNPPTMSEVCELQDLSRPSVSRSGISESESVQVLAKSGDSYSPSGLVAFCQSNTSAFTSVMAAKHASLPVVVERSATKRATSQVVVRGCDTSMMAAKRATVPMVVQGCDTLLMAAKNAVSPVIVQGCDVSLMAGKHTSSPVVVEGCDTSVMSTKRATSPAVVHGCDASLMAAKHVTVPVVVQGCDTSLMSAKRATSPVVVQGCDTSLKSAKRASSPVVVQGCDTSLMSAKRATSPVVVQGCDTSLKSAKRATSPVVVEGCDISLMSAKRATSPVVVQGCDQRIRDACSARNARSFTSDASFCHNHCETLVTHSAYSVPPFETNEPVQTFTESPVSEYDVASSYEQNSLLAADESLSGDQSSYTDGCNKGLVAHYPSFIPVPVPAFPPHPQYFHSHVPGMTYPYPTPMPAYMMPMTSCYSSVMQPYSFPAYPVMSPPGMMSGMMPPVGMVPMTHSSFPVPAPCSVPPSVMCYPESMPLPKPMQPSLPR